jgi:hypothetical protein
VCQRWRGGQVPSAVVVNDDRRRPQESSGVGPATRIVATSATVQITDARLPETYERARAALATCERIDECKDWADNRCGGVSAASRCRIATSAGQRTGAPDNPRRIVAGTLLVRIVAKPLNWRVEDDVATSAPCCFYVFLPVERVGQERSLPGSTVRVGLKVAVPARRLARGRQSHSRRSDQDGRWLRRR